MLRIILMYISLFVLQSCGEIETVENYDVIVIGQGTGGICAGISAAREGVKTLLITPSLWLGGMLTAAGVSAFDGNHRMPAGLFGEFRNKLYQHYGTDSLMTGWISNTLFEPSVGENIFKGLANQEKKLQISYESEIISITAISNQEVNQSNWEIIFQTKNSNTLRVRTKILIDGTDLGDIVDMVGADYDLGMEAQESTKEDLISWFANDTIQDLTYCAILETSENAILLEKPNDYNSENYKCACQELCDSTGVHPCETMLSYGKLPNSKYLINWPINGNDFYVNDVKLDKDERNSVYQSAKDITLGFVYYIQHELGFDNLQLAQDEFPTQDLLPIMPYHREGRRVKGKKRLTLNHIIDPYSFDYYKSGIAVGDYPIDHHHDKAGLGKIEFPRIPSYNIPLEALIPQSTNNLLVADKAISVSNVVNGTTRLQPVIMQIGQAAGILAATSIKNGKSVQNINPRVIQQKILDNAGYIMPFIDILPSEERFKPIQRVGATGILRGKGIPYKWANQTWFYPDSTINNGQEVMKRLANHFSQQNYTYDKGHVTLNNFYNFIKSVQLVKDERQIKEYILTNKELETLDMTDFLTKSQMALLIDHFLDPFSKETID